MRGSFCAVALLVSISLVQGHPAAGQATPSHLGFDRNTYPGDANLKALHQTFSYTGYWLNNPPGEKTNLIPRCSATFSAVTPMA